MKTLFGGIGILTLAIVMGLCLGFGIQAYAVEYDSATCPDGPFDSAVFVGNCPLPEGQTGLCYDIDANFECTPLPDECVPGNDCERMPEYCFNDGDPDFFAAYTDADGYGVIFNDPNISDGQPLCNMNPGQPCSNAYDAATGTFNYGLLMPCIDTQLCENIFDDCPGPCGLPGEPECPPGPCGLPGEPECPPGPCGLPGEPECPEEAQSFLIIKATCFNKTTEQKVIIKDQSMTLDCEAAGLEMSEGDEVFIKMKGIVLP